MQLVDAANVQVLQREIGLAALCTPANLRHVVELDPADSVDHRLTPFVQSCFNCGFIIILQNIEVNIKNLHFVYFSFLHNRTLIRKLIRGGHFVYSNQNFQTVR